MLGYMARSSDQTARHLQVLAALVLERRVMMDLSVEDAAKECGLAPVTYRNIEKGLPGARESTYVKLEAGLGMVTQSCQAVLDGADSITLKDGTKLFAGARVNRNEEVAADLSEEFRQGVMDVVTMVSPHISGGEAQEVSRRAAEHAMEVLRRHGLLGESG